MVDHVNMVMFWTTNVQLPFNINLFDLKMCVGYGIEFMVSFIFIQILIKFFTFECVY